MATSLGDVQREDWDTVEADEEAGRRILDMATGRASTMTRTDLAPFAKTRWVRQPYLELVTVINGWGTLLTGEPDEPERITLSPGIVVGIDPEEWWMVEAGGIGVVTISFWEGSRGAKHYR